MWMPIHQTLFILTLLALLGSGQMLARLRNDM